MKTYPFIISLSLGALTLAPSMALSQTQYEMNMQALSDFKKSDVKLNEVYQKLISKLDAESKKDLIASQKSWLAFRDNEAKFEADSQRRKLHSLDLPGNTPKSNRAKDLAFTLISWMA